MFEFELEKALLKNFIGKLWALPATLIGITAGLIGVCFAPHKVRICIAHNAICFYNHPFMCGRAIALTLGNVIFFQQDNDYFMGINIAEHEKQHTFQAEVLGIFYIPLHIVCLAVYGRNVLKNPLERGPCSNPPKPW